MHALAGLFKFQSTSKRASAGFRFYVALASSRMLFRGFVCCAAVSRCEGDIKYIPQKKWIA